MFCKPKTGGGAVSDTPETDGQTFNADTIAVNLPSLDHQFCHASHARKLERQRDEYARDLSDLIAEYDDRKAQWGDEYLWTKHEDAELIAGIRARMELTPGSPAEK